MRGQCEIKLIDKDGKTVHQEKHHNLVTNFFQEYYKELGPVKGLPYDYTIANMIGGILLFQEEITADADNVLLPAGNRMIGNGATLIVQGSGADVKELGTYIEDGTYWIDNNTYQVKYEWAPSQAVGTIRCVCLTSRAHGFIGEGNETSMAQRVSPSSSQTSYADFMQNSLNLGYNQIHKVETLIHYIADNLGYSVIDYVANGRIGVNKYYVPTDKIDFRHGSSTHAYVLKETVNYNIPEILMEDIRTYNPAMEVSVSEDGKVYFVIGRYNYSSSTGYYRFRVTPTNRYVYCFTYDTETDEFSYKVIDVYSYYVKETGFMAYYDGTYLVVIPDTSGYFVYSNQHMMVINTDTMEMSDLGAYRYGNNVTLYRCDNHQFYLYASVKDDNNPNFYRGVKIDAVRGVWSPINMTGNYVRTNYKVGASKFAGIAPSQTTNLTFNRHGDYLATIYNLPSPVTKTSDLTMQITYTLTFNEDES